MTLCPRSSPAVPTTSLSSTTHGNVRGWLYGGLGGFSDKASRWGEGERVQCGLQCYSHTQSRTRARSCALTAIPYNQTWLHFVSDGPSLARWHDAGIALGPSETGACVRVCVCEVCVTICSETRCPCECAGPRFSRSNDRPVLDQASTVAARGTGR